MRPERNVGAIPQGSGPSLPPRVSPSWDSRSNRSEVSGAFPPRPRHPAPPPPCVRPVATPGRPTPGTRRGPRSVEGRQRPSTPRGRLDDLRCRRRRVRPVVRGSTKRIGLRVRLGRYLSGRWFNLTPFLTKSPSPRWDTAMVFDARDGYVVLFGGCTGQDVNGMCSSTASDTWEYLGIAGTWKQLIQSKPPPPPPGIHPRRIRFLRPGIRRHGPMGCFDHLRPRVQGGSVVLFGGASGLHDFPPPPPGPELGPPDDRGFGLYVGLVAGRLDQHQFQSKPPGPLRRRICGRLEQRGGGPLRRDQPDPIGHPHRDRTPGGGVRRWQRHGERVERYLDLHDDRRLDERGSRAPGTGRALRLRDILRPEWLGRDHHVRWDQRHRRFPRRRVGVDRSAFRWRWGWTPAVGGVDAHPGRDHRRIARDPDGTRRSLTTRSMPSSCSTADAAPRAPHSGTSGPSAPRDGFRAAPSPSPSPPVPSARYESSLTFDDFAGSAILFGGESCDLSRCTFLGDTWSFSNGVWQSLAPSNSPSPRFGAAIAYDPLNYNVYLFGGCGSTCPLADTWVSHQSPNSAGTWTQLFPPISPPGTYFATLTFDPAVAALVLFGGCEEPSGPALPRRHGRSRARARGTDLALPPSESPPARFGAAATFSPHTHLFLYGGMGTDGDLADIWTYGPITGTGSPTLPYGVGPLATRAPIGWEQVVTIIAPPGAGLRDPRLRGGERRTGTVRWMRGGGLPGLVPVVFFAGDPEAAAARPTSSTHGRSVVPGSGGPVGGVKLHPVGLLRDRPGVWDPAEGPNGFVLAVGGRAIAGTTGSATLEYRRNRLVCPRPGLLGVP